MYRPKAALLIHVSDTLRGSEVAYEPTARAPSHVCGFDQNEPVEINADGGRYQKDPAVDSFLIVLALREARPPRLYHAKTLHARNQKRCVGVPSIGTCRSAGDGTWFEVNRPQAEVRQFWLT